jgi:hypothetical protein
MKARPASSFMTLGESMEHVVVFDSRAELEAFLKSEWLGWKEGSVVTCEKYGGFDGRVGWDTHLICVDGKAVLFSDGPLPEGE